MKKVLAVLALSVLSVSSAHAISGGESCASADASVRITYDMFGGSVEVLKGSKLVKVPDAKIEEGSSPVTVTEKITNDCANKKAGDFTYDFLQREYVSQVKITRPDNAELPGGHGASLEARVFCSVATMIPSSCK